MGGGDHPDPLILCSVAGLPYVRADRQDETDVLNRHHARPFGWAAGGTDGYTNALTGVDRAPRMKKPRKI